MSLNTFLTLFLVIAPQIRVVEAPTQIRVDEPSKIVFEMVYPEKYQPVPGSLLQSLVQQNSPFPSPFTVLKEISGKPIPKEDLISQLYTYEIQPKLIGPTTLLAYGSFEDDKSLVNAFAKPVNFEVTQVHDIPPLFPQPFIPEEYVSMDYFNVRSEMQHERSQTAYSDSIAATLYAKSIPWIEILLAFLAALILAFWSFWRYIHPRKQTALMGVTRFGIMRQLRRYATARNSSPEIFFQQIGRLLRQYLHLPQSMTDEEVLESLQKAGNVKGETLGKLKELQLLSQPARFGSLPSTKDSYNQALSLVQNILDQRGGSTKS